MKNGLKWNTLFDPMIRRRVRGYVRRKLGCYGTISYAQFAEDIILRNLFDIIGIAMPIYLDIGAHHPKYLSNTYLFYRQGSKGLCIEPDPALVSAFRRVRPRDTVLGVGVAEKPGELDFFVMSSNSLNTFSPKEALHAETLGHRIEKRLRIPVITINGALEKMERTPDFVSIDVEGLDEALVSGIDFDRFRSAAFCVETLTYAKKGEGRKKENIFRIFSENGYMPFADTHVNTIFVDEKRWRNQQQ